MLKSGLTAEVRTAHQPAALLWKCNETLTACCPSSVIAHLVLCNHPYRLYTAVETELILPDLTERQAESITISILQMERNIYYLQESVNAWNNLMHFHRPGRTQPHAHQWPTWPAEVKPFVKSHKVLLGDRG